MRREALLVIGLSLLAVCREPPPAPMKASRWVAPERDVVIALTQQPAACDLASAQSADPRVLEGEALFNSPLLLGGQAAKAGLSCGACHRNGRGNPDFAFGNAGAPPGHTDVTDALFGHQRDDGVFNPVAIPDLADPAGRKVARTQEALMAFIDAQLVEEFDAAPPARETVRAIAIYVAALSAADCADGIEAMGWQQELTRAQTALRQSEVYAENAPETERALRLAARAALGRLHERYPFRRQADLRDALTGVSLKIADGVPSADLEADFVILAEQLEREAPRSLYEPARLRRVLAEY